ncbi:hypothetical protein GOP47_0017341 [Adiantum capillus-veneris]|uniref:Uncharacterized protein n=1 Tax=Adiantum capillus-veneris TaxID=13818 RepID=A0A9D4UG14_ADICA|nr:hypothetical protein GOP47_0017341 [Adiantum capillus-veneris]
MSAEVLQQLSIYFGLRTRALLLVRVLVGFVIDSSSAHARRLLASIPTASLFASCYALLLMLASISVNAGLNTGDGRQQADVDIVERIDEWSRCTAEDILIVQGAEGPGPDGIPIFRVNIYNLCEDGCAGGDIHVACGWFASAIVVDPTLFRRVVYDDCVVNGGRPLAGDRMLSFRYANSAPYSLSVSAVSFLQCRPAVLFTPSPSPQPLPSPR